MIMITAGISLAIASCSWRFPFKTEKLRVGNRVHLGEDGGIGTAWIEKEDSVIRDHPNRKIWHARVVVYDNGSRDLHVMKGDTVHVEGEAWKFIGFHKHADRNSATIVRLRSRTSAASN